MKTKKNFSKIQIYKMLISALIAEKTKFGRILDLLNNPVFLWERDLGGKGMYRNQVRASFFYLGETIALRVWGPYLSEIKKAEVHIRATCTKKRKLSWRVDLNIKKESKFNDRAMNFIINKLKLLEKMLIAEGSSRLEQYQIDNPGDTSID